MFGKVSLHRFPVNASVGPLPGLWVLGKDLLPREGTDPIPGYELDKAVKDSRIEHKKVLSKP